MTQNRTLKRRARRLLDALPYVSRLRERVDRAGVHAAGDYYSPIPSAENVRHGLARAAAAALDLPDGGLADIDLNREGQRALLGELAEFYPGHAFLTEPTPGARYTAEGNTMFLQTDAVMLYLFLRRFRPPRVVEVGSGFSSAVMLDTLDRFGPEACELTFIEPFPDRLLGLVDPDADPRVTLVRRTVQQTGFAPFARLQAGDLLFIDSSHVVKCGSDVQMLLFDVLPRLPAGVLVHFHDIFFPFEYPADWVEHGRYWNEAYFLRAFLAGNRDWEIALWNHYANREFGDLLAERLPAVQKNLGGSLYLRKLR